MEQQKNFLATEPVGKLFRRLAFTAACCPYDNAGSTLSPSLRLWHRLDGSLRGL